MVLSPRVPEPASSAAMAAKASGDVAASPVASYSSVAKRSARFLTIAAVSAKDIERIRMMKRIRLALQRRTVVLALNLSARFS